MNRNAVSTGLLRGIALILTTLLVMAEMKNCAWWALILGILIVLATVLAES